MLGHSNYVHALALMPDDLNCVFSASEDGTLRLWDMRTSGVVRECAPAMTVSTCSRDDIGEWLGCVASNGSWVVTGGGPLLTCEFCHKTFISKAPFSQCGMLAHLHTRSHCPMWASSRDHRMYQCKTSSMRKVKANEMPSPMREHHRHNTIH